MADPDVQSALDAANLTGSDVAGLIAAGASVEQAIAIVQARLSATSGALLLTFDEDLLKLGVDPVKVVAWAQAGVDTTHATDPGWALGPPTAQEATMLLDAGLTGHQIRNTRNVGLSASSALALAGATGAPRLTGMLVQVAAEGVEPDDLVWLLDGAGLSVYELVSPGSADLFSLSSIPDDTARRIALLLAMTHANAVPARAAKALALLLTDRKDKDSVLALLVAGLDVYDAIDLAAKLEGRSRAVRELTVRLVRDGMAADDALAAAAADELLQAAAMARKDRAPARSFVRMPPRWVRPQQVEEFLSHDGTVNDEELGISGSYLNGLADSLDGTGFSEESPLVLSVDSERKTASVLDGNHRLILLLREWSDLPGVWVPVVVTDEPGTDPGVPYDGRFGWPKARSVTVARAPGDARGI